MLLGKNPLTGYQNCESSFPENGPFGEQYPQNSKMTIPCFALLQRFMHTGFTVCGVSD